MDTESRLKRLNYIEEKHKKQHAIVEALEAENAPDTYIMHAKRLKLSMKDEIETLKRILQSEGVNC